MANLSRWKRAVLGGGGFIAPLIFAVLSPAAVSIPEYQVKAAFLLNFTRFVEWPSSAFEDESSPVTICILGDDPFGETLDQIVKGETSNGRRIEVRRLQRGAAPKGCQVLFSETLLDRPAAGPVLTVSDDEKSLTRGAVITFVLDNRRVRFSVNLRAASHAGLSLSSKLLRIAKEVQT